MGVRSRTTAFIVLALLVATAPAFAEPKNQIKVFMLNTGVDLDAKGKVLVVANKAQTFFQINASRLDPNQPYDIALDGVVKETVTANPDGVLMVKHRARRKGKHAGTPLPYDPRSATLAIQSAGVAILVAEVPATPADGHQRIEIVYEIPNLGVIAGAAGAEFQSRFGRMKFNVEMEGAPAGTYDLIVGGVKVADIVVGQTTFRGKVEFDSRPCCDDDDSEMEILLTFDPRGKEIKIQQVIATVPTDLFAGTFPLVP